jgi:hypothetical protein
VDHNELSQLVGDQLLPLWRRERRKLNRIDRWARWDHDKPSKPKRATSEHTELAKRAQAPWGDLIVSSVAQTLNAVGYRRPDDPDDTTAWRTFQANRFGGRQVALYRSVLTYGIAYGTSMPGVDALTGEPMPVMRAVSPRDMVAVYADVAEDEWPQFTLAVSKVKGGYRLRVLDDTLRYTATIENLEDKPKGWEEEVHEVGVTPVVRYCNRFDLEGRSTGEVEPFIPLLGKIDQTSYDRLIVQRFASWIVKTIAGMSVEESAREGESSEQAKIRLSVEDFLVAEDKDTKFGSLPATQLDGFIKAHEADKTDLAAVSQTPAFELLGQMANLSAEALAAAKASQTAKSDERKLTLGEDLAQHLRLNCAILGDADGAADFAANVRWADTSIRSLSQAADALGKLAQQLGVPVEVLWPKIPGFTQTDIDEAKEITERGGGLGELIRELKAGQVSPEPESGLVLPGAA